MLLERDPETGRYPQRLESQSSWLLPMVEAIRQTVITLAQERQLDVVATNSDGDAARRAFLLSRLGTGAAERVIDPGIDVVHRRLSISGRLSGQCRDAAGPMVREAVMEYEQLLIPLEFRADETRESPGFLSGVLMRYGAREPTMTATKCLSRWRVSLAG